MAAAVAFDPQEISPHVPCVRLRTFSAVYISQIFHPNLQRDLRRLTVLRCCASVPKARTRERKSANDKERGKEKEKEKGSHLGSVQPQASSAFWTSANMFSTVPHLEVTWW